MAGNNMEQCMIVNKFCGDDWCSSHKIEQKRLQITLAQTCPCIHLHYGDIITDGIANEPSLIYDNEDYRLKRKTPKQN